jgi:hypothetical protein
VPPPPLMMQAADRTHSHTNDARTDLNDDKKRTPKGTILSPKDRKVIGDGLGKPVTVATRDKKTGKIVVEHYLPSDNPSTRQEHQGKDSSTEKLDAKAVERAVEAIKAGDKTFPVKPEEWRKIGE